MSDDKQDISVVELVAMNAAKEGSVSDILEMLGTEGVPEGIEGKVVEILQQAVEVATEKRVVTEAIAVIGAEGVPEAIQLKAVDTITKNGSCSWIGGLIGKKDIPEIVQIGIVDALAEGGWVSEILEIVGAGNTSDAVTNKARFALAKASIVAGEHQVKDLTREEMVEALGILSRIVESRNPLQKEGVLSEGTVKKPASAAKSAKDAKKGMKNKS